MRDAALTVFLCCAACSPAQQPDSNRTVAAFEVPLPTSADKATFLQLLRHDAVAAGFHVDSASAEELRINSAVSPITFNATVWRGANDDEVVASAMDFADHLGRVWISFPAGQDRRSFTNFRQQLMLHIVKRWPSTLSLPIMPTGAIPLPEDMDRTLAGYRVRLSAEANYQATPTPTPSAAAR